MRLRPAPDGVAQAPTLSVPTQRRRGGRGWLKITRLCAAWPWMPPVLTLLSQTLLPWTRAEQAAQQPTNDPVIALFTEGHQSPGNQDAKERVRTRTLVLGSKVLPSLPGRHRGPRPRPVLERTPLPGLGDPGAAPPRSAPLQSYQRLGVHAPTGIRSGSARNRNPDPPGNGTWETQEPNANAPRVNSDPGGTQTSRPLIQSERSTPAHTFQNTA